MSESAVTELLRSFEHGSEARMDCEFQPHAVPTDAPIFHYTDAGGFKGIIENDNIWLTERTHLNDPTELAYGLKYALDWCDQHVDVNDRLARVFFASFRDGLARTLNAVGAYVTSFSLGGNVLSQWCRYADDGRGFCLEFSPNFLDAQWIEYPGPAALFRYLVNYNGDEIRTRQETVLTRAREFLTDPAIPRIIAREPSRREFVVGMHTLITHELLWNALQFKHQAYDDEQEARLLLTGDPTSIRSSALHKTRVRKSELVSYVELPFAPSLRSGKLLRRVIVGPAASNESKMSAKAFLESVRLTDVEVIQSEIPYRSMR